MQSCPKICEPKNHCIKEISEKKKNAYIILLEILENMQRKI